MHDINCNSYENKIMDDAETFGIETLFVSSASNNVEPSFTCIGNENVNTGDSSEAQSKSSTTDTTINNSSNKTDIADGNDDIYCYLDLVSEPNTDSDSESYFSDDTSDDIETQDYEHIHLELRSVYLNFKEFISFQFNSNKVLVVESEPGYVMFAYGGDSGSCNVCFDYEESLQVVYCGEACQTMVCFQCLEQHIEYKIMDGVIQISCPGDECGKNLSDQFVAAFTKPATLAILTKNKIAVEQNPNVKTCPGCHKVERKNAAEAQKAKENPKILCSSCGTSWCFTCYSPWHSGVPCKVYQKDVVSSGQKALRYWAKCKTNGSKNAKKCPSCSFYIERISGCDHMTCNRCKTDFCYQCGGKHYSLGWFGNHYSRYSFLGCKYNLHPNKPVLRVAKRAGVIAGVTVLSPLIVSGACVTAVCVTLALPSFFVYKKCKK